MTFTLVRGRVLRVTKLDGCGNLVPGPKSTVTSDGFTSVALTAQTDTGEAISVTNANGKVCISDTPAPTFTGYQIVISFCQVDPYLYTLLTGQPVVMDSAGTNAVGFNVNSDVTLDGSGFALELWSSVPSAACGAGGAQSYGYFLLPFCMGGIIGDFTIENAAITFQVTGAQTKDGTAWGVGPYSPVMGATVAGPLNVALSTKNHLHMEQTTVPPPDAGGAVALGVPATLITAGIPATLTPALSYPPATLATMGAVAKSPTTAWTTGQYVLLQDGSKAHWNATTWVVGPA